MKDPTFASKPDMGVSMRRPPKNDEWDFKDKGGFFSNSILLVSHKVDNLNIEVFAQDKATGFGSYDIKDAANGEYKNISGFQGIMDPKKITAASAKLPGGGAGNVQTQYLEMTFKRADKPMELRMWVFIGKNQNLYKIVMTCDEGMYKKHQKVADYILASVDIFKPGK
ncbi:MAG: hypothetical protein HY293_12540 [Planctomycetes bacterium]|nr:hypothetical protein [Planctomycetota bacterium]